MHLVFSSLSPVSPRRASVKRVVTGLERTRISVLTRGEEEEEHYNNNNNKKKKTEKKEKANRTLDFLFYFILFLFPAALHTLKHPTRRGMTAIRHQDR